jgi:hypothetical protein
MRPSIVWRSAQQLPLINGIPELEGMKIVENLLGWQEDENETP